MSRGRAAVEDRTSAHHEQYRRAPEIAGRSASSSSTSRRLRTLAAVVPLLLALAPASPASASPPPSPAEPSRPAEHAALAATDLELTKVKLTHVNDMVHARKYLFVSTRRGVEVLTENGKTRKRLKHLPEARGMAVSPDGDRVYVAVRDKARVIAIDTRRLKVVERFKVGQCPTQVALAGGRLFYAREQCDTPDAAIESIDPRKGGRPVASGIPAGNVNDPIFLVGGGTTLVTGTPTSSSEIRSYRISGAAAVRQAWHQEDSLVRDLAVSPDGATVYVPNNPSGVRAFPTSTLTNPVTYPTGNLPLSVAASRDGRQVAAVIDGSGPDLFVFHVGSTSPALVGSTPVTPYGRPGMYAGTLTFSGNGKRVFQLRADSREGPTYLVSAKTQPA